MRQWLVARILGVSPFSDEVTKLNLAQVNWIIGMFDKENPGALKKVTTEAAPEVLAQVQWADRLMGKGLQEFLRKRVPSWLKPDVSGKMNG